VRVDTVPEALGSASGQRTKRRGDLKGGLVVGSCNLKLKEAPTCTGAGGEWEDVLVTRFA
jgi:hypothetical protein